MRPVGTRFLLTSTSILALVAIAGPDRAFAACTYSSSVSPFTNVFALTGDSCAAAATAYSPTSTPPIGLPVPYTGFGFFAYFGGVITSPDGVTITTQSGLSSAYGVWSDGLGAQIYLGATTVSTSGVGAFGYYASSGGVISASGLSAISVSGAGTAAVEAAFGGTATLSGGGTISSTGSGAIGLKAIGSGSSLAATGVDVSAGSGGLSGARGVVADSTGPGGGVTLTGGSVTTFGTSAIDVLSTGGATVKLDGTSITSNGNGSLGLSVSGAGSSMTGDGLTVTILGSSISGLDTGAAINSGGALTLSDSSLTTTGTATFGVYTTSSGATATTTLVGVSVDVQGAGAFAGVASGPHGSTTVEGGSITTEKLDSIGLYADGAGAFVVTTLDGDSGTTITTKGSHSAGVQVDGGGQGQLDSGSVTTMGAGSPGLFVTDSGSKLTASGVEVLTSGGFDSGTGSYAAGLLASAGGKAAFSGGSITTGGKSSAAVVSQGDGTSVTLTGPITILTKLDGSAGLEVTGGASLTATGVSVTTQGGIDSSNGFVAAGAYNGFGPGYPTGGTLVISSSTVLATGGQTFGVLTANDGMTTLNDDAITVTGDYGFGGVTSSSGGQTVMNGGSVTTEGAYSPAVYNGSTFEFTGGGTMTISGGSIMTSGEGSIGVFTSDGGVTNMSDSSVATSGQDAHGLVVYGSGSAANLSGTNNFATEGDGAFGLYATAGGLITASGLTIVSTSGTNSEYTGFSAFGVYAEGGGSEVDLAAANVTTTGEGAVGLYAAGAPIGDFLLVSLTGGTIVVSGPLSVTTDGDFAYGAWADSAGSTITLNGPSTFTINGAAYALYATAGGVVTSNGSLSITVNGDNGGGVEVNDAGSSVALNGATSIAVKGSGDGGLFAASGGAISATGSTTITVSGANSAGVVASSGSVTASGPLNVTTQMPSSPAFLLSGDSPSIIATGGGVVSAAGKAIEFLSASNAIATFDNFTINALSGDLVFADPTTATVNFNNTTANAGFGNLLNATGGSVITLNASASTLTGAIQTDSASTSTVNLLGGSLWMMTGSSFVSNLMVANSGIVFAPPGFGVGFKTLTVGSYAGSGASLSMNTMLGGSSSPTDQLIIDGGAATGSTALTINNAGGTGAQTTGNGIPIILTKNGGSIAAGAFDLTNPPVVGGYRYTLSESDQAWYLVSSPTSTQNDIVNSVNNFAKSQQQQMVTNRVLSSLLLGATEQVNCSNCSSAFGSIGSYSLGAHGRWGLSDNLTVLGGFSYGEYNASGVTVSNAPTVAASLIYDFVNWGKSRPFVEVGGGMTPYEEVQYSRSYVNGFTTGVGNGKAVNRNAGIFGRVGWVARLTPIDEAAVYADLSRSWMSAGGYTEATSGLNPYPMTVQSGIDALNVARIGGQYTHLFAGKFEANVTGALAYGFGGSFGNQVNVFDFGTIAPYPIGNSTWFEYGARVGYRLQDRMVIDAFVIGTVGGEIGTTIHGGLGLRYLF